MNQFIHLILIITGKDNIISLKCHLRYLGACVMDFYGKVVLSVV